MRRLLILCRHGNTFNTGEKVYIVGAQQDLALTPVGKAQAVAVGQALKRNALIPSRILAAPLKRTLEFAELVGDLVGSTDSVTIDTRLIELDYGLWGGLSDAEIAERWGGESLDRWQLDGIRPSGVTFYPSEPELEADVREFLIESASFEGTTLAVTSNGRLREFSRLIVGVPRKVRTGAVCVLEHNSAGNWKVVGWDIQPDQLALS
jgi:broad specificity phosphatase PhoE